MNWAARRIFSYAAVDAIAKLCAALTIWLLIRTLDRSSYGLLALMLSLHALASDVLHNSVALTYTARATSRPVDAHEAFAAAIAVVGGGHVIAVIAAVSAGMLGLIAMPLALAAIAMSFLDGVMQIVAGRAQVEGRTFRFQALILAPRVSALLAVGAAIAAAHGSLAMAVTALVAGRLLPVLWIWGGSGRPTRPRRPAGVTDLARETSWMAMYFALLATMPAYCLLLARDELGLPAVADLGVAFWNFGLATGVLNAIQTVLRVELFRSDVRQSGLRQAEFITRWIARSLRVVLPLGVVIVGLAPPALTLLNGRAYTDAALPAQIMLGGAAIGYMLAPTAAVLRVQGRLRELVGINLFGCFLCVAGATWMVDQGYGATGIAAAFAAGHVAINVIGTLRAFARARATIDAGRTDQRRTPLIP